MHRVDRSPADDTTTVDFLIFVTNGSQPGLPPAFFTKSGVNGPLGGARTERYNRKSGERNAFQGERHGAARGDIYDERA